MAVRAWKLTDVDRGLYLEEISIQPDQVGGAATGYSVTKRRLRGGQADGVDLVEIDNGKLRVSMLPTRGMGIWKIWRGDFELGWKSPVRGPVHPQFVPLWEPSGIGWLAGFDEFLCRCGLESNGAPEWDGQGRLKYPLHGKIANTPAHQLELSINGDIGEIALTGTVDEARLYHGKLRLKSTVKTRVGQPGIQIIDEITNLSAEPGELEYLYHINAGQPLLENGAKVLVPLKTLVPRNARAVEGVSQWDSYSGEQPGFTEQVYFMELAGNDDGRTSALLRNAHGTHGMALHFNKKQLPTFTLWKSTQAATDGYVTGLEPGVNFPNPRSFEKEQQRVVSLRPGQTLSFELGIELLTEAKEVAAVEASIGQLQAGAAAKIYDRPLAGWTPG